MIVTRTWLSEYIDLSAVSNEKLYETFNAIGLEIDSLNEIKIADKVLVGEILSVEKHPDADKLNVCQIDIGTSQVQIVCGAANVKDAKYVAVATIGAVLPEDFVIKDAKLRGVESAGMVCASTELGLPEMGKGIMILDESIGTLEAGRALSSYESMNDTIIELELTANRGDCLCIYGVARDLCAALDIEMNPRKVSEVSKGKESVKSKLKVETEGRMDADVSYQLASLSGLKSTCLITLRLAMVGVEHANILEAYLAYATHATGVILRSYDADALGKDTKISLEIQAEATGIMAVKSEAKVLSYIGVNQDKERMANQKTGSLLIEASYIHPDTLVEAVAGTSLKQDSLYYKTSRGSSHDLDFGLAVFASLLCSYSQSACYEGTLAIAVDRAHQKISVSAIEVSSIIGMDIDIAKISTILEKLGFTLCETDVNTVEVSVPLFRHDMRNIQDITEEIVRIIGINNIEAKPFVFAEQARLNSTTARYKARKAFKNNAVGAGFYENVSYVFSDKKLLEKYGFMVTDEALELANPIAEELNTLRSTILINLLLAAKRNVSYSKKSIPLFEIGQRFDNKRAQSEVISFVFSGLRENESIHNAGKPSMIDFAGFVQKVGAVIGAFELEPCSAINGLLHPYQSANIVIKGKVCGFISKLHPSVQDDFDLPVTFIAEIDFDSLLPMHINAMPISKFQGVYKDLSIVIDKSMGYYEVAKVLNGLSLPMLKDVYPVDIYEDEALGDKKSLSIRFFIQSMEKTLEDADIESVMGKIMFALEKECKAGLR